MTESIRSQLVALTPGQSYSDAIKLEAGAPKDVIRLNLKKLTDRVAASVARAKTDTGSNFVTNTGSFLTSQSFDLMLCVVVTREN